MRSFENRIVNNNNQVMGIGNLIVPQKMNPRRQYVNQNNRTYAETKQWIRENIPESVRKQRGIKLNMKHTELQNVIEQFLQSDVQNVVPQTVPQIEQENNLFNELPQYDISILSRRQRQLNIDDVEKQNRKQINIDSKNNVVDDPFDKILQIQDQVEAIIQKGNSAFVTQIKKDGTVHKRQFNSGKDVDDFLIDGMNAKSSDIQINEQDILDSKVSVEEIIKNPLGLQRILRSVHGMGQHMKKCQEIDNELVYIPPSGQCLRNIIQHEFVDKKQQIAMCFQQFCQKQKIFREDISRANLSCLCKSLWKIDVMVDICYYQQNDTQQHSCLKNISKKDIPDNLKKVVVCIFDEHYVLLKQKYGQALQFVKDNLVWQDKTINDLTEEQLTETIQQKMKDKPENSTQMFHNTYIWDMEAYRNDKDLFIPYSVGCGTMQNFYRNKQLYKYPDNESRREQCEKKMIDSVNVFTGEDCIEQFIDYINKENPKQKSYIKNKKGNGMKVEQKCKITCIAHNSAGFDSWYILKSKYKMYKIIKKGGIMSLTIETENCKIKFIDSCKFILSSLDKLCKSYKCPKAISKSSIEHNDITKDNYLARQSEWEPYLRRDITSLQWIWFSFSQKMFSITGYYPKDFISIASYAKNHCDAVSGKQKSFVNPVLRKFIQKGIRGGRVQALKKSFRSEELGNINLDQYNGKRLPDDVLQKLNKTQNGLIPVDATSLYPSAMCDNEIDYPDISSCKLVKGDQLNWDFVNQYKAYFVECDIYIPADLKFVPISYKDQNGMAQFRTGYIKNVVLNTVDVIQMKKFGIQLKKIHCGVVFEKTFKTPYKEFIKYLFSERKKVKSFDSVLGDCFKLIMNSSYGKMCEKEHTTSDVLCSNIDQFKEHYYDQSVSEYQVLDNGQVLYEKNSNSERVLSENHMAAYILSSSKKIMDDFVLKLNAHKEQIIYYMDTDSMYIHKKYVYRLGDVKDDLGGGKNDYGEDALIIQAEFLGPKQKLCYSVDLKTGIVKKNVTFKGVQYKEMQQFNLDTVEQIQNNYKLNQGLKNKEQKNLVVNHFVWKRNHNGVVYRGVEQNSESLETQNKKVVRNDAQLNKYNLINGIYQYINNPDC